MGKLTVKEALKKAFVETTADVCVEEVFKYLRETIDSVYKDERLKFELALGSDVVYVLLRKLYP